jgi:hypothetical protein
MARIRLFGVLLMLAYLSHGVALADDIVWDHANGTIWSNFYTSPYYAFDKSIDKPAGALLTLFCIDYNDDVAAPFSWSADVTALSPTNIQKFQFGGSYPGVPGTPFAFQGDNNAVHPVIMSAQSDAYHRYLEGVWLFTNSISAGAASNKHATIVSQVAAWNLLVDKNHIADLAARINGTTGTWAFDNYVAGPVSTISSLTFRYAVNEAVKAAQNAVLGGWLPSIGWSVVTAQSSWVQSANGGVRVQELLTPYVAHTPEPASIALLLTSILVTIPIARRRVKSR